MTMARIPLTIVFALCYLVIIGCKGQTPEQGIVAMVNGSPIFLKELEARYDLERLSWGGSMPPSVPQLREDYEGILTMLIVQRLVEQELAQKNLSVNDEELAQAEEAVRADYPSDEFEKVLVEDYIDLASWRQVLRQSLQREKLFSEVFRPSITLGFEEADAYYKNNINDFYLPKRLHFFFISGDKKKDVKRARDLLVKGKDREAVLQGASGRLVMRELKMREDRIHGAWKQVLTKSKVGEGTAVVAHESGFETFVLLEVLPEKLLPPAQAYPLIEKLLVEKKVQEAYAAWLEDRLRHADIQVSALLKRLAQDTRIPDSNQTAFSEKDPAVPNFEVQSGEPQADTEAPVAVE